MSRFTADQLAFAASKTAYMGRDESIELLCANVGSPFQVPL